MLAATCQEAHKSVFFVLQGASRRVKVLCQRPHASRVSQGHTQKRLGYLAANCVKQELTAHWLVLIPLLHVLVVARANFRFRGHHHVSTPLTFEKALL